jgi:transposase-like protein
MTGHVHRGQQGMVAAALRQVFQADSKDDAHRLCREVIGRLEPVAPKVAHLLEEAEDDLVAFYAFPVEHWPKLRSTNPLERVNREIARRSDVVGIYPNEAALLRLATSLLVEQNDEWLVGRRYMSEASLAQVLQGAGGDPPDPPPAAAALAGRARAGKANGHA